MGQGAFVLEHVSKVTAVDPTAASRIFTISLYRRRQPSTARSSRRMVSLGYRRDCPAMDMRAAA
jgi:hypothetical protein